MILASRCPPESLHWGPMPPDFALREGVEAGTTSSPSRRDRPVHRAGAQATPHRRHRGRQAPHRDRPVRDDVPRLHGARRADRRGQAAALPRRRAAIVNTEPSIAKTFEITGLDQIFTISRAARGDRRARRPIKATRPSQKPCADVLPRRTPGGTANRPLPVCWMYSLSASDVAEPALDRGELLVRVALEGDEEQAGVELAGARVDAVGVRVAAAQDARRRRSSTARRGGCARRRDHRLAVGAARARSTGSCSLRAASSGAPLSLEAADRRAPGRRARSRSQASISMRIRRATR